MGGIEGGFATASGHPMYTLEAYLRGEAGKGPTIPYVTGATNVSPPPLIDVVRNIGGRQIPVKITDYGPDVKGLDIASENKQWAKNFPYQGQTEAPMVLTQQAAVDYLNRKAIDPLMASAEPTFTRESNPAQMSTFADYSKALNQQKAFNSVGSTFASALGNIGAGMAQQASNSTSQALSMLLNRPHTPIMPVRDEPFFTVGGNDILSQLRQALGLV